MGHVSPIIDFLREHPSISIELGFVLQEAGMEFLDPHLSVQVHLHLLGPVTIEVLGGEFPTFCGAEDVDLGRSSQLRQDILHFLNEPHVNLICHIPMCPMFPVGQVTAANMHSDFDSWPGEVEGPRSLESGRLPESLLKLRRQVVNKLPAIATLFDENALALLPGLLVDGLLDGLGPEEAQVEVGLGSESSKFLVVGSKKLRHALWDVHPVLSLRRVRQEATKIELQMGCQRHEVDQACSPLAQPVPTLNAVDRGGIGIIMAQGAVPWSQSNGGVEVLDKPHLPLAVCPWHLTGLRVTRDARKR